MRQALGRGLEALIPGSALPEDGGAQKKVPISSIRPNHLQPRKHFDPEKLAELAQSIKEHGVVEPIVVSYDGGTNSYELIAGERRLRASQLAGLIDIDVVIRDPRSEKERLAISLIENLQREDLNAIEEALGYLRLMKEFGINQTQLGQVVGKSKSAVSNTLRLLELPEEIQKALQFTTISEGHARALLSIQDPNARHKAFQLTLQQKLSVREVEELARQAQHRHDEGAEEPPRLKRVPAPRSADERALEDVLQQLLGTRVEIKSRKNSPRGTVVLHYYGLDEFERIVGLLKRP